LQQSLHSYGGHAYEVAIFEFLLFVPDYGQPVYARMSAMQTSIA